MFVQVSRSRNLVTSVLQLYLRKMTFVKPGMVQDGSSVIYGKKAEQIETQHYEGCVSDCNVPDGHGFGHYS